MDPQKPENAHQDDSGKISTRWTPTIQQINVLKELFYIKGIRSPTSDQIHTICACLKRFGKVEGKNVFYWFQNHKARDRQKKRPTPVLSPSQYRNRKRGVRWKQDQDLGISCSTYSTGVNLVTMENKEISISEEDLNGGNVSPDNPESPPSKFLDKLLANIDEDHDRAPEIETLPLFPMHPEEYHDDHLDQIVHSGYYTGGYWWVHGGQGGVAALDLSLNSYSYDCYDF